MFSDVKKSMQDSKVVRVYIYLLIILTFGLSIIIPIWYRIKHPDIISIPFAIAIGFFILITTLFGFLFNSRVTILKSFLTGRRKGIIAGIIILLIVLIPFIVIKVFYWKNLDFEFWIIVVLSLCVIVLNYLRLREIRKI